MPHFYLKFLSYIFVLVTHSTPILMLANFVILSKNFLLPFFYSLCSFVYIYIFRAMDQLIIDFQKLAETSIFTLRIELRCQSMYYLDLTAREVCLNLLSLCTNLNNIVRFVIKNLFTMLTTFLIYFIHSGQLSFGSCPT